MWLQKLCAQKLRIQDGPKSVEAGLLAHYVSSGLNLDKYGTTWILRQNIKGKQKDITLPEAQNILSDIIAQALISSNSMDPIREYVFDAMGSDPNNPLFNVRFQVMTSGQTLDVQVDNQSSPSLNKNIALLLRSFQIIHQPVEKPVDVTKKAPLSGTNKEQDYDTRIATGLRRESKIRDVLKDYFSSEEVKVIEPSSLHDKREDKIDKIDGWIIFPDHTKKSIQIKYRDADSGDDVLFEVVKHMNWDENGDYEIPASVDGQNGRDAQGKADLYVHVGKNADTVRVFNTKDVKDMINKALQEAQQPDSWRWQRNTRLRARTGLFSMTVKEGEARGDVVLRITPDPRTRQDKLMAYIPYSILTPVYTIPCQLNEDEDFQPLLTKTT